MPSTILTKENSTRASTVSCIAHPEWGTKRFNFDPVHGHHSHGTGSNSALLFAGEFHFWQVETWLPIPKDKVAEMAKRRETSPYPILLVMEKLMISGTLEGLVVLDDLTFVTVDAARDWVRKVNRDNIVTRNGYRVLDNFEIIVLKGE